MKNKPPRLAEPSRENFQALPFTRLAVSLIRCDALPLKRYDLPCCIIFLTKQWKRFMIFITVSQIHPYIAVLISCLPALPFPSLLALWIIMFPVSLKYLMCRWLINWTYFLHLSFQFIEAEIEWVIFIVLFIPSEAHHLRRTVFYITNSDNHSLRTWLAEKHLAGHPILRTMVYKRRSENWVPESQTLSWNEVMMHVGGAS